jgi:hypothetical protein
VRLTKYVTSAEIHHVYSLIYAINWVCCEAVSRIKFEIKLGTASSMSTQTFTIRSKHGAQLSYVRYHILPELNDKHTHIFLI